ncbi:MAG: translation initiation factor 1A [Halobacteriales archaeon]|jgi:translation initiation factor 1A
MGPVPVKGRGFLDGTLSAVGLEHALPSGSLNCPRQKTTHNMGDDEQRNIEDIRMPDDDEVFSVVTNMLGANRVTVRCADGVERTARIPGKMQKRIWIREDDVVLVEPWDWQEEKADITWRYEKQEADRLKDEGYIE